VGHAPSTRLGYDPAVTRLVTWILFLATGAAGCISGEDGPVRERPEPDAIYADFLDGKFDSAGHPYGASVLEAETDCTPAVGHGSGDAWAVSPDADAAGMLCSAQSAMLGRGQHTANVRASLELANVPACESSCPMALRVRIVDDGGTELGAQDFRTDAFEEGLSFQNLPVRFQVSTPGPVRIEILWAGLAPVLLDYVEVFRSNRQLVLEPVSGVLAPDAIFRMEQIDAPDFGELRLYCDDVEITDQLAVLLESGEAAEEMTDFRRIVTAPAAALFESCPAPRMVKVVLAGEGWDQTVSEVIYYDEPPPCTFAATGVRVLLTGFVPFPAGSRSVNSSKLAVESFDVSTVPGATVMVLVLPVEFDTAPEIAREVAERCAADVVVGFGQGRWKVDVETIAYNRKDTSEVSGGVPDNRGAIYVGEPVVPGGPDEHMTRLPVGPILADLSTAGVEAGASDDPGRYVCNDMFYSLMNDAPAMRVAGFVHLPHLYAPTDADRADLQTVVESVVRRSVERVSMP